MRDEPRFSDKNHSFSSFFLWQQRNHDNLSRRKQPFTESHCSTSSYADCERLRSIAKKTSLAAFLLLLQIRLAVHNKSTTFAPMRTRQASSQCLVWKRCKPGFLDRWYGDVKAGYQHKWNRKEGTQEMKSQYLPGRTRGMPVPASGPPCAR